MKINTISLKEGVHHIQLLSNPVLVNEEYRDGKYVYTGSYDPHKPGRVWCFAADLDGFDNEEGEHITHWNGIIKMSYNLYKTLNDAWYNFVCDWNLRGNDSYTYDSFGRTIGATFEINVCKDKHGFTKYRAECQEVCAYDPYKYITKRYRGELDCGPDGYEYQTYCGKAHILLGSAITDEYNIEQYRECSDE